MNRVEVKTIMNHVYRRRHGQASLWQRFSCYDKILRDRQNVAASGSPQTLMTNIG
jgi:hypothetical protein